MTNSLTTKTTSAAAVSRALARAGFRPLASGMRGRREGINVSGTSTGVFVSVDFDSGAAALRRADELVEVLAQDYEIRRVSPTILCVTGRSA